MKLKDNFHPFAIITIIFWSIAFVFTRLTLRYFSPFSLGFLRYFIASITLIVIAIIIKMKFPNKKDIKWFVLAGFSGFFFYMIVFNMGSVTVTAATGSIIIATTPIITTLLARIIYKEKIKILQYVAIIIEFIGVGILTLFNGIFSINIGIIWLIMASISVSLYNLLQRKLTKNYSAIQTVIISIWFGTIMLFMFLPKSIEEIKIAPMEQIIYLFILGIFSSAIAYVTWTYAFSKAKNASSVTNYMFLTPFLTTILGIYLANETPDNSTIIGGVIIIIGMLVYNIFGKMELKIKLRLEEEKDFKIVENVTREAFWNHHVPGCDEHLLIHNLRKTKDFIKELDFVATYKEKIIGNIVYVKSKIKNNDIEHTVLTFGPLSVLPEYQNKGVGSKLINHTIELSKKMGYKAIIIYGDPEYYKRFGFKVSKEYNITNKEKKYPAALLVLELYPNALNGIEGIFDEGEAYEIDENELEMFDKQFKEKEKAYSKTQDRFNELVEKYI